MLKFTANAKALSQALALASKPIEKRWRIPVLRNVLIRIDGDVATIQGTDMDILVGISVPVTSDTQHHGAVTLAAHDLLKLVKGFDPTSQIELEEMDGEKAAIRCGRSLSCLPTLPVEDWPVLEAKSNVVSCFDLTAPDLLGMLKPIAFAISSEETRYYLNGIYMHAVGPDLRTIATDGHRLGMRSMPLPALAGKAQGILPRALVNVLLGLLPKRRDTFMLEFHAEHIVIRADDVQIVSKLIDGPFPDYERIMPTDNDKHMEARRSELTSAIKRVASVSKERSRAIKFTLNGSISLTCSNPEGGVANEEVDGWHNCQHFEIGFNSSYLLDMLGHCEGDDVAFTFSNAASPMVMRDGASRFILMPMRV